MDKKIKKAEKEAERKLRELSQQTFACQADAVAVANKLSKKFKYHNLTAIPVQKVWQESSTKVSGIQDTSPSYKIQALLEPDASVIPIATRQAGRFVLATNVLEAHELSPNALCKYK